MGNRPNKEPKTDPKTVKNLQDLRRMQYYHGMLPRDEVNNLLKNQGEYLVRLTVKEDIKCYILSVHWDHVTHHIPMKFDGGLSYTVDDINKYESINDLVEHHQRTGQPIMNNVKLIRAKTLAAWELDNVNIIKDERIGAGAFGEVWKGRYMNPLTDKTEKVAIKLCKDTVREKEKRKFLQEARLMRHYIHDNVVRLFGIAAHSEPLMIVMELVAGGSLDKYLSENNCSVDLKLRFCRDAAKGMTYLETMNCIHNDLSARNCLLTAQLSVKISDFGMSRQTAVYVATPGKALPIRWTAPEALPPKLVFSHKSDVWSFGILIWEIFNDAQVPYPHLQSNREVHIFVEEGKRMEPIELMHRDVARIMLDCWEKKVKKRPNFVQILHVFENVISASSLGEIS